jgi:putative DNA methylase
MTDKARLIEFAFPLEQASIDSVHEKNVRHGHISTLHIWPARRPLAAARAALIATLLPDPSSDPRPDGMSDSEWENEVRVRRKKLCERIGGTLSETIERKKMPNGTTVERKRKESEGGVLHWLGTEPSSGGRKKIEQYRRELEDRENELGRLRDEIRHVYGGRAPRVLDPFAGGGAIPLEAMRLGCQVTASDINPVAWFVLKCTLEYPQKFTNRSHPLPDFILGDDEFLTDFYKAHPHLVGRTKRTTAQDDRPGLFDSQNSDRAPRADLAWHIRAWGRWILRRARIRLAAFYPTYAAFEPLDRKAQRVYERQPLRTVPLTDEGSTDIGRLNREFSAEYLGDPRNPRWIAKPTVAYLWARTVTCKNCRAVVPLLKTRWLAKKEQKRVLLTMEPNHDRSGVVFGIQTDVPVKGGNAAQKREYDKKVGAGTMSRSGAQCPCCPSIMTMDDLRSAGKAGRLGLVATAVVTEGNGGKEYRLPLRDEAEAASAAEASLDSIYSEIPFGMPVEPTPDENALGMRIPKYGFARWSQLFTERQLLALGSLAAVARSAAAAMKELGYTDDWAEALSSYAFVTFDKTADYGSSLCTWHISGEKMRNTFARFALPVTWDIAELAVPNNVGGSWLAQLDWVARYVDHALLATKAAPTPHVELVSATVDRNDQFDVILTDPPYYDAIPYSDCMDFFYTWLRRLGGDRAATATAFAAPLSPKWDLERSDGELIDDASRHGGDASQSKSAYESGMAKAFRACNAALADDGRFVVVFAHKHPAAWETLVAAIVGAGFVVDGSWPIQTEMGTRMRARGSAALASSVWLVCRKRPLTARPGWDQSVLSEMRVSIARRLRDFWDAGVRGPDFVWAATGPGLEAYSKHPVVKKANEPGATMSVPEFLVHVRRMVVDFVIGQVLTGSNDDLAAADRLDAPTAYYLLHRNDFGDGEAPAGACILYATACGLTDRDLEATWDLVMHTGGDSSDGIDDESDADSEDEERTASESGSKIRLRPWYQRKQKSMGYDAPGGQTVPIIDRVHRLMHLWRAGDVGKVDEYLDEHGLRRQELFRRVLQSLIELAEGEERALLESISNHVHVRGAAPDIAQLHLNTAVTPQIED